MGARGAIVGKYMSARGLRILRVLDEIDAELGTTPAQIALAWLIARPGLTPPITSATSLPQLNALIAATRLALSPPCLDRLNDASDQRGTAAAAPAPEGGQVLSRAAEIEVGKAAADVAQVLRHSAKRGSRVDGRREYASGRPVFDDARPEQMEGANVLARYPALGLRFVFNAALFDFVGLQTARRRVMHFDIVTIRVFVAVAEELSITAAARRENIAASAISKRIQNLEVEAGVRLFRRHRSGVQTTTAGQALYRHCREMLAALDRAESDMCLFAGAVKGSIKLAATTSATLQSLPDELRLFLELHPAIRIELLEMPSNCVVQAVRDGSADIGIYSTLAVAADVTSQLYRHDSLVVLVPLGHSLANERRIFFSQTLKFRHVCLGAGSPLHAVLEQKASEMGHPLEVVLKTTSTDAVRRFVQAGLGIGILPAICVLPYAEAMGVRGIPLADAWASRELRLCVKSAPVSPAARLFFDHLAGGVEENNGSSHVPSRASSIRGSQEAIPTMVQHPPEPFRPGGAIRREDGEAGAAFLSGIHSPTASTTCPLPTAFAAGTAPTSQSAKARQLLPARVPGEVTRK